ncbi:universal stress protein UspE [Aestuariibacter halophilus]|uniref:Universal stress protein UspE n=1 Tax=Fluctibacter halophilus TaxID=226011 RepID=A0ABS8G551_9ALTE|nr:universal stress protein UspE [Aestuariibacter halophilus]MCC2615712.1 universal stress protein UspE [Aestuariibacter halophilus]
MGFFSKILAVIDPETDQQKALKRAVELAQKTNASVTAFLTIYDFSYDMTTMLSVEERETMRQAVVDDRTDWVSALIEHQVDTDLVAVDIKVVWHNRPYESIVLEAIESQYDLIVKGTQDHDTLKSVIFTPTDWHLLRKAPTPVLLVKEHDWPQGGQIIGAVNVGTDDEAHAQLNDVVTETAQTMAELLKGTVNLVNAYPGTPVNIAIEIPEFDPKGYRDSVKAYHTESMQKHISRYDISMDQCHIREGLPEDAIPAVAKLIDAELVVIGTVGRVGISAALIGNTAEHVIDRLDCDVLALKPTGFESPIRP